MKKRIKFISVGCSLIFLLGIALPVSASAAEVETDTQIQQAHIQKVLEENKTYEGFLSSSDTLTFDEIASLPGAVVASEYDKLEDMKKQPVSELYAMGMSASEVAKIQTTSTKDLILENASRLSDVELQEKGLDKEAISAIRNGEYELVTEAEARAVTASLAIGIGSVSRVGTSANYNIYWHWDARPLNLWTDTLAASIDGGYSTTVSSTAKVGYSNLGAVSADPSKEERITPTRSGGEAVFEISMLNATGTGWAVSGKAFVANTGSYLGALGPHAEYFHAWLRYPQISIGGGIISFDYDAGSKHTADGYIPAA